MTCTGNEVARFVIFLLIFSFIHYSVKMIRYTYPPVATGVAFRNENKYLRNNEKKRKELLIYTASVKIGTYVNLLKFL